MEFFFLFGSTWLIKSSWNDDCWEHTIDDVKHVIPCLYFAINIFMLRFKRFKLFIS